MTDLTPERRATINAMAARVLDWRKRHGFVTERRNILNKLCLAHSEVSEAVEDARRGRWKHMGEELADILIRVFDIGASLGYDLEKEFDRKMRINEARPHRNAIPEESDE